MAQGKKTVRDQAGKTVTGDVVDVEESIERFSDITLKDGTLVRIKPVVVDVIRADGQWDNEGNPIYVVRSTNVMTVNNVDESLKKKVQ